MSGKSLLNTDQRKPVKVTAPKAKSKPKPLIKALVSGMRTCFVENSPDDDDMTMVESYRKDYESRGDEPNEHWTLVLIPSVERDGEAVAHTLVGSTGSCVVLLVPPIGNQEGLQRAANLIKGVVAAHKLVLVYLGARSISSSVSHSITNEPPYPADWVQT